MRTPFIRFSGVNFDGSFAEIAFQKMKNEKLSPGLVLCPLILPNLPGVVFIFSGPIDPSAIVDPCNLRRKVPHTSYPCPAYGMAYDIQYTVPQFHVVYSDTTIKVKEKWRDKPACRHFSHIFI
jgi:hypothetical protein